MKQLVTVILPCRGREALLRRALISLLAQEERRWRAVVVDDASPEPLAPLVESLGDPRLSVLRLPRRMGPAGAREAGLAGADTPYVAYLDSDDVWAPWKLTRQLDQIGPGRALACAAWVEEAPPSPGPERGGEGRPAPWRVGAPLGEAVRRARPLRPQRPGQRIADFLYVENGFAQASGMLLPADLARRAGFGALRQYEDHFHLIKAEALGAEVMAGGEILCQQGADAGLDRLGLADHEGRGHAFLDRAGALLTEQERRGFRLRHLGAAVAARDRKAALSLSIGELGEELRAGRVRLTGAAAKLGLRAAAGDEAYRLFRAAARLRLRSWRTGPTA